MQGIMVIFATKQKYMLKTCKKKKKNQLTHAIASGLAQYTSDSTKVLSTTKRNKRVREFVRL